MANEKDSNILDSAVVDMHRCRALGPDVIMGSRRGPRDLSERGVTVNVQHMNDNEREVSIPVGTGAEVYGTLRVPPAARGIGHLRTRTRTIAKATINPRVVNDFAALMKFARLCATYRLGVVRRRTALRRRAPAQTRVLVIFRALINPARDQPYVVRRKPLRLLWRDYIFVVAQYVHLIHLGHIDG
jgi:hypothetical protein